MGEAEGFAYVVRDNGDVMITHRGRQATVLRGPRAAEFVDEVEGGVEGGDAQGVMARWTGNYKRGNERRARDHPRNRRNRR